MKRKDNGKFTIVIPAYNEEEIIESVLAEVVKRYSKQEIILVDDGSTDKTYEITRRVGGIKIIRHPYNKGYGAALKTGIRNASHETIVLMDGDGQHNPQHISRLAKLIGDYDMVVGARTKDSEVSFFRQSGKKALGLLANYLAGMKIPDLNSGFRAVRKDVALRHMHILPNTFSFTTTITLALIKDGYSIKYEPVKTVKRVGKSKIKPFRNGFEFILLILRTIVLFDPLKVFLPAGLLFLAVGTIDALYYLIIDTSISKSALLLIFSGLLIFCFGLLADQVAAMRREDK